MCVFKFRRARAPPPHSVRGQGMYPAPRSLPESGEDTLVQAILNLDRGYERMHDSYYYTGQCQPSLNIWQRKRSIFGSHSPKYLTRIALFK